MKIKLSDSVLKLVELHPSISARMKYLVNEDGSAMTIRQVCSSNFNEIKNLKSFGTNSAFRLNEVLAEYGLSVGMNQQDLNDWESKNLLYKAPFIEVHGNDGFILINKKEISVIEDYNSYCIIHLENNKTYKVCEPYLMVREKVLS